ncbi:MAG TPA: nucleotidyltransferase family protein [Candidatus Xenobia bacterium]|jgi:hypothetical protein
MQPTARLLIAVARQFLGTATPGEVQERIEGINDWSGVAARAREEGLEGILVQVCQVLRLDLPLQDCRERVLRAVQLNVDYVRLLNVLGMEAERRGLRMLLLKGGALLPRVYAGRVGRRPLRDLDVLVRPADADRMRTLLLDQGFRGRGDVMAQGRLTVDLHTSLVSATRIRQRAATFDFNEDLLWETSLPLNSGLPAVRILDPTYEFCYLAVHALKHSFERLIWLIDLALLQPPAVGDRLLAVATQTRTRRVLTYVMVLLESVLGYPPLAGGESLRVPLDLFEERFLRAVQRRHIPEAMGELVAMRSLAGTSARARYLWELCFPQPAVLADSLGDMPPWLLYPRRFSQLVGKAVRERSRLWELFE